MFFEARDDEGEEEGFLSILGVEDASLLFCRRMMDRDGPKLNSKQNSSGAMSGFCFLCLFDEAGVLED